MEKAGAWKSYFAIVELTIKTLRDSMGSGGVDIYYAEGEKCLMEICEVIGKLGKSSTHLPHVKKVLRRLCRDVLDHHITNPTFWVGSEFFDNLGGKDVTISLALCRVLCPEIFWPSSKEENCEDLLWLCEKLPKLPHVAFSEAFKRIWIYSFEAEIEMSERCKEIMEKATGYKAGFGV